MVDQNIYTSERGERKVYSTLHVGYYGCVRYNGGRLSPQTLNFLDQAFCLFPPGVVGDQLFDSTLCKLLCGCLAHLAVVINNTKVFLRYLFFVSRTEEHVNVYS